MYQDSPGGRNQNQVSRTRAEHVSGGESRSSLEIEHNDLDDVAFSEAPRPMDRIRRGISKQYSTVADRTDRDAFNYARKSSLLAEADGSQSIKPNATFLTSVDVTTIERLDADYEKALLQREIGWNARYISVRQNSGLSLWFFFLFIMCGTIFFEITTDWTLSESLLFSMYTITTVGYGQHIIPDSPTVQIFICFYIFVGIAMLTVLAAQLYQWIVLEVTWAQYERDSNKYIKRHKQNVKNSGDAEAAMAGEVIISSPQEEQKMTLSDKVFDGGLKLLNWVQAYVKDNPAGQLMIVLVPFSILILLGAVVVGSVQGWDFVESLYFAVVSMTTVGYGDYYPSSLPSTWFCIFWLPFSVGFLSLYLGSVAVLYIDVSGRNVRRIENKLRRRINKVRAAEERERAEAMARGTSGGFDLNVSVDDDQDENRPANTSPSHLHKPKAKDIDFLSDASITAADSGEEGLDTNSLGDRRENILHASKSNADGDEEMKMGQTMKSMKDVINAITQNIAPTPRRPQNESSGTSSLSSNSFETDPHLSLKSTRHYNTARGVEKKPSFALRVLVQERFSKIIANDIAGFQSNVQIKNNTLSVTIDSLKHTAEKWEIPRRARKSFRAVAFEVLFFVGERALIVRGADAVFELRPHEVQGLFAPLLAAFGDADTMEAWLMRTQVMAEEELNNHLNAESRQLKFDQIEENRAGKITQNMTATPNQKRNVIGNAVKNKS